MDRKHKQTIHKKRKYFRLTNRLELLNMTVTQRNSKLDNELSFFLPCVSCDVSFHATCAWI